jgi:D-alanyl-D-alanine carboxypeptidase
MQAIVDAAVDHGLPGVSATVIAADGGTWTGAAGTADGEDPLEADARFAIASITKTVIAAEVMYLSEEGLLRLSDQVSAYLPDEFHFNTNGATIENLLAMESGIPDPTITRAEAVADPGRIWDPTEILETVPDARSEPGDHFVYEDSNYMLLGLVIEEVTGTSVAIALRSDVLADPRLSALVYQPEERPDGPFALPFGGRDGPEALELGGGYLPSAAETSWGNGSGCMASDSASLAMFGYLLFGGSLVSEHSLMAMTDFGAGADYDRYGLGVFEQTNLAQGFTVQAVGNGGWEEGGYSSVLVVLPSEGVAISVMTNTAGDPVQLVMPVAQELASALDR